jgi:hypothetical protein
VAGRTGRGLTGSLDLAGLQAAGAGVDPLRRPVHQGPDPLNVRIEPSVCPVVGMGHPLAEERSLPADLADGCHGACQGNRPLRRASAALPREDPSDAFLEGRRGERPRPGHGDAAIGVIEDRVWLAHEPKAVADGGVRVEDARVRPSVLGHERPGRGPRVQDVHPQELDPGAVGGGGGRQIRGLHPTRPAPSRPDVHDHRGASELAEKVPVRSQVELGKRRRIGREQRRLGRVPRRNRGPVAPTEI